MTNKQKYSREKLIDICERAFVPQEKWSNRDTARSQIGIGSCYALLKAGCYYEILTEENTSKGSVCVTDAQTIWIQFWVHDFQWFECGSDCFEKDGREDMDYHFYLPTPERLEEVDGKDWY